MSSDSGLFVTGSELHSELRLEQSPLVRVLCQLRWPDYAQLRNQLDGVAQELSIRLSESYPLISSEPEFSVTLTPAGLTQGAGNTVYRFADVEGRWRVSFGTGFISLETSQYTSRSDFAQRFGKLLESLSAATQVPAWNRLGYRYTNRLTEPRDLEKLSDYFTDPVLGGHLLPLNDGVRLVQNLTESVYRLQNENLLVRSARLDANQLIDPSLPPVGVESWTLDIDAFEETSPLRFDSGAIVQKLERLSSIGYQYFRAITTEEFVTRFK